MEEREKGTGALLVGGLGGTALGAIITALLMSKPAEAAPPEEKWNYLLACLEVIIGLLEQIKAAQGEPVQVEVTVSAPWVAKDPEAIFDQAIRNIGVFDADKMVDFTRGKRLLFKVESTLDQAVNIQVVGNSADSYYQAVNIAAPWPCVANGNISIGLAWDDWHPFVGIQITTAVAPTTGMLKIWAVIQE